VATLKITFLGTGTSQGVPVINCKCKVCRSTNPRDNRTRSSILVENHHTRVVIDTGPDFRQQCLRAKPGRLHAVIFTHEHKDHIAGLDDVRAFNFIYKKAMPVYSTSRVYKALQREFAYIFSGERYPGIPEIEMNFFEDEAFHINDLEINPINLLHYHMPVKGFRIADFAYITDANYIDETEKKKLKNLDVLILNALRREKHISHFTLQEAIALATELGAKKTYFTHISHQLGLHDEVNKELPDNMELGFDGLQIVL